MSGPRVRVGWTLPNGNVTQPFKEVTEGIHPFCLMLVRVDILLKVLVDVAVFR